MTDVEPRSFASGDGGRSPDASASATRAEPPTAPPPPPPPGDVGRDIERVLRSITGVLEAEVRRGDRGQQRLRLRLDPQGDAPAVAERVATTLAERFGIELDADDLLAVSDRVPPPPPPPAPTPVSGRRDERHHPVHVVLVDTPPADDRTIRPAAALPGRVAFQGFEVQADAGSITARVDLTRRSRQVTGESSGPATRAARRRALADATVAALAALTGDDLRAGVDRVLLRDQADPPYVTVTVTVLTEQGEATRIGTALVHADAELAVVRATLDALNRLVEGLLS